MDRPSRRPGALAGYVVDVLRCACRPSNGVSSAPRRWRVPFAAVYWSVRCCVLEFSASNRMVFYRYIGSYLDISHLKRVQENALEGQKLESMGLLASGMAHDFNNLLGGILTSAELAMTESARQPPFGRRTAAN
jgi:signal transduction histidine kinase